MGHRRLSHGRGNAISRLRQKEWTILLSVLCGFHTCSQLMQSSSACNMGVRNHICTSTDSLRNDKVNFMSWCELSLKAKVEGSGFYYVHLSQAHTEVRLAGGRCFDARRAIIFMLLASCDVEGEAGSTFTFRACLNSLGILHTASRAAWGDSTKNCPETGDMDVSAAESIVSIVTPDRVDKVASWI
ncbi:hypothetical protein DFJ77DRAFT_95081 [Powellomyces hirtus]|nr:hypothetical protein DFJ77DRAFT_95081 [Powellomyces hirtus]